MNDLLLDEVSPNVVHLQHMQGGGEPFPAEELESGADNFQFQMDPYTNSFTSKVKSLAVTPTLGSPLIMIRSMVMSLSSLSPLAEASPRVGP
jgi:hypothetical protein